ncbi:MAG: protein-export chaperone SecB [Rivihabitans pingtungensis]|jgi:preprotein translocase subunit SecB|uniref:protein-export chaperone SecB n=1 Tax=Rivihabitans pingtungensis TaxID=1054498 RepID=UPI002CA8F37C|nr:protein-export chaperone SecB [Rivihabitans pingtungensis]HNX71445.1 protein-export chaperone SecB [Rivihabitans pingtungensis]
MSEQDLQPVFSIEKIYVKDLSLEIPHAPQIFLEREQPEIDMQLATEGKQLEDGVFEAVITVTVTAKLGEKVMFLVEAAQAGIFQIRGVPEEEISGVLAVACPNILFPYVRETVSDVVNRAGFPPVLLSPINFEALYAQQMAEQSGNAH